MIERRRMRRSDDWRISSKTPLNAAWMWEIASRLGYDPRSVLSVRMNDQECTVVALMQGDPVAVRHPVVTDQGRLPREVLG